MTYFTNKVAVVTGAGSGIGRALALGLAGRGARLAIADLNDAGLAETADLLRAQGAEVFSSRLNVSDRDAVAAFAKEVTAHFGVVHQIYNNAGIGGGAETINDTPYDTFEAVLAVNLWGVIHGTKEFLPHVIASGDGHVINISSLNGIMAQPRLGAYVASKFAVRGFTETLRTEMIAADLPVAVTVVHPGGVKTNIAKPPDDASGLTPEARKRSEVYEKKLFKTTADAAAATILDGVARKKGRVLIGQATSVDRLVRLIPERYPALVVAWSKRTFGSA